MLWYKQPAGNTYSLISLHLLPPKELQCNKSAVFFFSCWQFLSDECHRKHGYSKSILGVRYFKVLTQARIAGFVNILINKIPFPCAFKIKSIFVGFKRNIHKVFRGNGRFSHNLTSFYNSTLAALSNQKHKYFDNWALPFIKENLIAF